MSSSFLGAQDQQDRPIINHYGSPVRKMTSIFANLNPKMSYALDTDTIKVLDGTTWQPANDVMIKKMKSMFKKQPNGTPSLKIPAHFGSTVAFTLRTLEKPSEKLPEIYVLYGNTTIDPKSREVYAHSTHGKNIKLHRLPDDQIYMIDEETVVPIDNDKPELTIMSSTGRIYLWVPANCPAQTVKIYVCDKKTKKKLKNEAPAYQITIYPVI